MTTSSNGFSQREGKLVVTALALAVMFLMCGSVEASRLLGSLASAAANISSTPPPPDSNTSKVPIEAGAPHANRESDVLTLAPAPSVAPDADDLYSYQPTPQPESGDDSFMVHSTTVSAMQVGLGEGSNQCTYTIITSTGDIEGAGTQADVNVEFFDRFGASVLFVGLKSQNRNFNRGATDTFTVLGDCLQNICRMRLSHDDAGHNPSWFVNTVTISVQYQTRVFNVYEWLAKDEPPRSLSRTINSCPA
ncbi:PLAT domain-containing protein 1 isoform X4 [Physcomitrium patens]|uniref:PLAT domain-containing protein n=1 Tax=Physcomitrium patens TaxID=3218 RepID=A0A7I4AE43_PHYPA